MDECEQRKLVVAEALSWASPPTPYHHHARIKGVGVDCAQLLCAVYEAAAAVPPVDPGFYATDWHLHRSEEMFLAWLAKVGAWRTGAPQMGDVAVFRYGRTFSHGAVMVEPTLALHAYKGAGVILTRLHEAPLAGRDAQFWTLFRPQDAEGPLRGQEPTP